jgi:hypothetical protein
MTTTTAAAASIIALSFLFLSDMLSKYMKEGTHTDTHTFTNTHKLIHHPLTNTGFP